MLLLYRILGVWLFASSMGVSIFELPGKSFNVVGHLTPALIIVFASTVVLLFSRKLGELISRKL